MFQNNQMQRNDSVIVTTYICDHCNAETQDATDRIELDTIQEENVLLFEKPRQLRLHTRNYVGASRINFCSENCIKAYLYNKCDNLVTSLVTSE
jgi:hypothetical protein